MQAEKEHSNRMRDTVLILAHLVIIFLGMRYAQDLVVPFLLSLFIAIIAAVPVSWLKNCGLSLPLAVVVVLLGLTALEILLAVLLGSTVEQFSQSLPAYQARLQEISSGVMAWLTHHGVDVSKSGIENVLDPGAVMRFANALISGISSVLSNVMLIMLTVMFMLLEAWNLPGKINAMNSERSERILASISDAIQSTKQYTSIKALMSLITGSLIWACMAVVGLDFAVLWGFLAFLLNFIPTVGSIIAAVPAVLLAMVQLGLMSALIVIVIFLAVNLFIGNMVEPKFMGEKIGLSTLVVFLSMVFWGWLLGPVGMLLSVPLTMVVKFAAMSSEETQWFSILLGTAVETADKSLLQDTKKN
jgi:predicted PurR-regulated permease PerM